MLLRNNSNIAPLVSVVTPVYNGDKYIAECVDSVLGQTYTNWEYIIVNNCSTDRTPEIVQAYALQDERIRVYHNHELINAIPNWNHALRQISAESRYCKMVLADDWIFPECLSHMVDLAETYPSVGIVSAYRLDENQVNLDGLPYPSPVTPGHDIARMSLWRQPLHLFGSPTSLLVRSDLVHSRKAFYDESMIHADTAVCFDILQDNDFGFVHQVLTFTRRHHESITAALSPYNTILIDQIRMLQKYGPIYLSDPEYRQRLNDMIRRYHGFLARNLFQPERKIFWAYHRQIRRELGIPFRPTRMFRPLCIWLLQSLLGRQATQSETAMSQAIDKLNTVANRDV